MNPPTQPYGPKAHKDMKEISLPITQTFSITIDTHNIDMSKVVDLGDGKFGVHLGSISSEDVSPVIEIARKNGGNILYATTSIEQQMESILLRYFMGPFVQHEDRRELFEREIIQSSSLSYSTKKELVSKVINSNNLLDGKKKNNLQAKLKKIMEWRNAFAHGKIQYDSKAGCSIKYYSGGPKNLVLTDTYWNEVEECFNECTKLLGEVLSELDNPKQSSPSSQTEN